ncbi:hypothetical protein NQZ68_007817 [Dissostichus eleginoides]|nr:hypothetical protein NQZ68_007817 [Dissostichus eleginoides]
MEDTEGGTKAAVGLGREIKHLQQPQSDTQPDATEEHCRKTLTSGSMHPWARQWLSGVGSLGRYQAERAQEQDEKQEKRKSVQIRHPSHPLLPVELTEKAQRMCNWQQRWSFPGGLVHTAFTSYPLPPMHDGTPLNASQIDRWVYLQSCCLGNAAPGRLLVSTRRRSYKKTELAMREDANVKSTVCANGGVEGHFYQTSDNTGDLTVCRG